MILKINRINGLNRITEGCVEVNDDNHKTARLYLLRQNTKAVNLLKKLKNKGIIKSLSIPKSKGIQPELNFLITAKRQNLNSYYLLKSTFKG
jgi:hypothetical protein